MFGLSNELLHVHVSQETAKLHVVKEWSPSKQGVVIGNGGLQALVTYKFAAPCMYSNTSKLAIFGA